MDFFHTLAENIGKQVQGNTASLLFYAGVLAAVGTLSMALLEIFKDVFRLRMRYNRWALETWTADSRRNIWLWLLSLLTPSKGSRRRVEENPILQQLLYLAVGGHDDPNALYDQPVEKMMGQIQAAANVAIDYPKLYGSVYDFLASKELMYKSGSDDPSTKTLIGSLLPPTKVTRAVSNDGINWKDNHENVHSIRAGRHPAGENLTLAEKETAQAAADARARLNHFVSRKLDAFQNETGYFWDRLNHWGATLIGMIILLNAMTASDSHWWQSALIALPAGVIAPFAKQFAVSLASFGK
jgi:hypothetical protein